MQTRQPNKVEYALAKRYSVAFLDLNNLLSE